MHCKSDNDNLQTEGIAKFLTEFPGQVAKDVSLSKLTTFNIGGPARLLATVTNPNDAVRFLQLANKYKLPVVCIGGGSNLLIDDKGFNGLVLLMEDTSISIQGNNVTAGSGVVFDHLIAKTLSSNLTGLEFASGIPGSCGGAVIGNAGCFGHEISEFINYVTVLNTDGSIVDIAKKDLDFSYRNSALKNGSSILLSIDIELAKGDTVTANNLRKEKIALRKSKHPVDGACAGSYFKNLEPEQAGGRRRAAGELLEKAGALKMSVGDAEVYHKHANIIVNKGNATCSDVLQLASKMQDAVREMFQVDLEPEVRYLSFDGGDLLINS